MAYGKTITIYLDEGTPDGIITASLSNWNGCCVKVPREDVAGADYEELDGPGVYFLVCTDTEDEQDAVYIGEAENLRKRLQQHILDFKNGKEKYFWQKAVMFTGSELNKTLIRYLEHNLTLRARSAKRYKVLTKNTYRFLTDNEYNKRICMFVLVNKSLTTRGVILPDIRGNSSSFVVLKRKSHTKKRNLNCGHILETVVTFQGRVSHLFHGN